MSAILPISTVRVSDSLVRTRLTQQVQSDQLALFRLQNQLSTGRRIFTPSEDAPSALRAITLQRNLERQTQLQTNLANTTQSLSAAGSALNETSGELTDIRASALSVAGTDATQEQRDAVIQQVDEAINTLLRFGNSQFRDNFLFGGSLATSEPFVARNGYVEYRGNEQSLQSFVDSNVLFDTNVTGQETLGGISDAVRGTSGLSPQLTSNTLLSQLNAGAGVPRDGAIQIDFVPDNPGGVVTDSTTIDLRAANTVGDVARLIEAGAPAAAGLQVNLVGDRLEIQTSGPTAGAVSITEVGQGDTAQQLGIQTISPASGITGEPLEPTLRLTTQLDTLLGARAQTRLTSAGSNNDLILTATQNGTNVDPDDPASDPLNGVTIVFSDTDSVTAGNETVDLTGGTLTVQIEPGVTTAAEVAAAINNASVPFTAAIDLNDALTVDQAGQAAVELTATATTAGGAGTSLDLASGLQVQNGDGAEVIDTSNVETVFDLLETLNRPDLGLVAELNDTQTGIDVRTRRSGADFAIGENGGNLATQLGLRTFTGESRLEDFNRGIGVAVPGENPTDFAVQNEFRIQVTDEGGTQTFDIDLSDSTNANGFTTGIQTVDELIARIASETGGAVQAELSAFGNGLVLSGSNAAITPAPASGTATLGGDTLTFDAAAAGDTGNQSFRLEVIDSGVGAGGLSVSVSSDTTTDNIVQIELGGGTPTTDVIAAAIEAQLTGFTVASNGAPPATITAPVGPTDFSTSGGVPSTASGNTTLAGDPLVFDSVADGFGGNQTFSLEVVDSGPDPGGLLVDVTTDGGVQNAIRIDLRGATPTTDTVAAAIQAQLTGFTVTSTGAPPATVVAPAPAANFATTGGVGTSGVGADSITISGDAAQRLGFFSADADPASASGVTVTSEDRNTLEVDSAFNSLIRLRTALQEGDTVAVGEAIGRLDDDLDRAVFAEAEVGARVQTLQVLEVRLQDEEVQIRSALSDEIDVDLAEAISEFTARQFALQASLQTSANLLQLSILNFI